MQIEFHETEEQECQTNRDDFDELTSSDIDTAVPAAFQHESFHADGQAIRTVEQLRQFITQNIDDLFQRALSLCYHSTDRAEEVVQELYPRMVRFLERHPEGLHEPWAAVHFVARRLAVDDYRRAARRWHEPLPDDDFLPDLQTGESEIDEAEHLSDLIHDAIATLDERLAAIVRGVFFDGRRGKAVAADLKMSESRFSELKRHALSQIRLHLEQNLHPTLNQNGDVHRMQLWSA